MRNRSAYSYRAVEGAVGFFWNKRRDAKPGKQNIDEIAREVAERIKDQQTESEDPNRQPIQIQQNLQAQENEVRALRDVIEGLRDVEKHGAGVEGVTAKLAEEAEEALTAGHPEKAKELFRKLAEQRVEKANAADTTAQTARAEAAQAYRRLGALAFLTDAQEAIEAYQKAAALAPTMLTVGINWDICLIELVHWIVLSKPIKKSWHWGVLQSIRNWKQLPTAI